MVYFGSFWLIPCFNTTETKRRKDCDKIEYRKDRVKIRRTKDHDKIKRTKDRDKIKRTKDQDKIKRKGKIEIKSKGKKIVIK